MGPLSPVRQRPVPFCLFILKICMYSTTKKSWHVGIN
jgi:hypothetical protein